MQIDERIYENVGNVMYCVALVFDVQAPLGCLLVPDRRGDSMFKANELEGVKLLCTAFQIVQNIRSGRVVL